MTAPDLHWTVEQDLVERAIHRSVKKAIHVGAFPIQPGAAVSSVEQHDGKNYIVLRNCNGPLAVYAISPKRRLFAVNEMPSWVDMDN